MHCTQGLGRPGAAPKLPVAAGTSLAGSRAHTVGRYPRGASVTMAGRVTFEKSRIITFSSLSEKEKESYMEFLVDNDVQVRGKRPRATAAWGSRAQYPQACCVPRWRVDGWLVCSCVEADAQP